ncbi:MAG: hypothetical protein K8R87_01930 [Verrucomicrobia bacterium]|nr:hypothetical protein [Verrucomicrobiota bacterium]
MSANPHSDGAKPGMLEEEFRGVLRKMHYSMKSAESYIGGTEASVQILNKA